MSATVATPFFANRTVVVVGLARSGVAAVQVLARHGCTVRATDRREGPAVRSEVAQCEAAGATVTLGSHPESLLEGAELVVVSPGVPFDAAFLDTARSRGLEVVSEIEVAAVICPAPIVAITGTNGKTTTTELTGHLFRSAGVPAIVAGNVGRAFSAEVEHARADGVAVLEVSSFQLETVQRFHPRVAALLNLTPDHLDRHRTMEAYTSAKARVFAQQTANDYAVLNATDARVAALAPALRATRLAFAREAIVGDGAFLRDGDLWYRFEGTECAILPAADLQIRGPHNVENALAAVACTLPFGLTRTQLQQGLATFVPLPHRLEMVGSIRGRAFYNDSKATNVDALEKALLSFDRTIVLIAGGRDKDGDFARLASLAAARVSTACLIGEATHTIHDAWEDVATVECATLEEAVRTAFSASADGEPIVLAPGCASFDMFRDYEDRGDTFRRVVQELAAEIASGRTG